LRAPDEGAGVLDVLADELPAGAPLDLGGVPLWIDVSL
jgi:hypothetical protein